MSKARFYLRVTCTAFYHVQLEFWLMGFVKHIKHTKNVLISVPKRKTIIIIVIIVIIIIIIIIYTIRIKNAMTKNKYVVRRKR